MLILLVTICLLACSCRTVPPAEENESSKVEIPTAESSSKPEASEPDSQPEASEPDSQPEASDAAFQPGRLPVVYLHIEGGEEDLYEEILKVAKKK